MTRNSTGRVRACWILTDYLSPGDGVLDIGGYTGMYARQYAKVVGPTGHVLSVEPDAQSVRAHRKRNAAFPQIEVLQAACYSQSCRKVLYRNHLRSANSLWSGNVSEPYGQEDADMYPLDYLASRVRHLRGIKIDAQGAEYHILQGGAHTLQQNDLTWQVELWPAGLETAGSSVRQVAETFKRAGWVPLQSTWRHVLRRIKWYCRAPKSSIDVVLVRQ